MCRRGCFSCLATAHAISMATAQPAQGQRIRCAPRGDTRGQPRRHGHPALCRPPARLKPTPGRSGSGEAQGCSPHLLWGEVQRSVEAQGQAPGAAGNGLHICSSEITRPGSDACGAGGNTAHSAGEQPQTPEPGHTIPAAIHGKFWACKNHGLDESHHQFAMGLDGC